jgi:SsrA-binding protein
MSSKKTSESKRQVIAQNRRARHDYHITETVEAGIMLMGTEVKSLRKGQASIKEAYAVEEDGNIMLLNANISEYPNARNWNHEPKRPRKLLLHTKEIRKLSGAISKKGCTLVPLSLYFNERGIVKVELGLAKGKNQADKRQTIKDRDWNRDKARIVKES